MNDKPNIEPKYVKPLKKICMTIGELPSSYLETMSYYEMLVWFVEFLKNQVIPALNNNAEAVQELQQLYNELKDYVNNYFDNLDVQEEINNKLEEMASDGTLESIIGIYLNTNALWSFDNVNKMIESANLIKGSYAETMGYYEVNDGGQSLYLISDTHETENGGSIINLANGLQAHLIPINNTINITQFGAKGDGENDDGISFQNALNYLTINDNIKKLILNKNKTYYINKTLTIFKDSEIDFNNSTILSNVNHIFTNFKSTQFGWDSNDVYTEYNGNGNIYIHNGIIKYGSISFIHGKNITLDNLEFIDTNNDHYLEICACSNYKILNCSFTGLKTVASGREYVEYIQIDVCDHTSFPWLPNNSPTYDGTINESLVINSCQFKPGNTDGYNNLYCAIGSHVTPATYHKNFLIKNNIIENCSYAGIYLIKVDGAVIQNNKITYGTGNRGINLQYGCKNINILNNYINNVTGGISVLNNPNYRHENIIIKNNNVVLSEGGTAYVLHTIDNIEIIDNYGYATSHFADFTDASNIVCVDNIYNNSTDTYTDVNYYSGTNTFKLLDMYKLILDTNDTTNKVITLKDDITSFNMLKVHIGGTSFGNWQELELKSYKGRNFQLGETYRVPFIKSDNSLDVIILTIDSTDAKKITYSFITNGSIHGLYAKVLKQQ